jgi:hypothetical protein
MEAVGAVFCVPGWCFRLGFFGRGFFTGGRLSAWTVIKTTLIDGCVVQSRSSMDSASGPFWP